MGWESMMLGVTLPVVGLLPDGSQSSDTVAARPCVAMGMTFQFSDSGRYLEADIIRLHGHIDTGCDFTAVDESVLNGVNSPVLRHMQIATANGTSIRPIHRATLFFFGSNENIAQETEFVTIPTAANPYKVILGRSFLKHTTFTYNGDKGITEIVIGR